MKSRTENSAHNLIYSIVAQLSTVILTFFSRTVFIESLGEEYLGINGLFSNIITILSLAELGIGTAIVYSMYQPISEGNEEKIAALVGYYKHLYSILAIAVTGIGLAFFPFLDFFINFDRDIPYIKYYYFLFLLQTVSSYLIVYRTSILTADQKNFLITRNEIIGNFVSVIGQILVLKLTDSYALYTIVHIVVGLAVNWINSRRAVRYYPYITEKHVLSTKEKKDIWINIKSMFAYKVGGVILNNTDNLLISKLVGTVVVGYYSNYSLLISKISNMVNLIFTSIQASLGNYNVEKEGKDMYSMFKIISFIEYWVYAFCSISFCLLTNDFIELWIGKRFVLADNILYVCVLNFYIQGVLYPIWCYRNTTGLFKDTRFLMYFAAVINLVLSILLGMRYGLLGILVSTAIARMATNLWYEPYILFDKYFSIKVKEYYFRELGRIVKIGLYIVISQFIFNKIQIERLGILLLVKIGYCVFVPNILLWIENRKSEEYSYVLQRVAGLVHRKL